MNATEKDNVFYCDCGFSWRRGMSGSHNCEDGLRAKLTDMAVQLANAESKCRELAAENETAMESLKQADAAVKLAHEKFSALAAENTGLNKFIAKSCFVQAGEFPSWHQAIDHAPETQATDAFLAEVRAQVWIEGSEPEEFGRYWVRYETDVGPQYCSAKWMEHNFCAGSNTNIHKIWLADHSRSINSLRGVTHYTKLPDSLEGAAQ
ncbi:hypothetical protein [Citrobacter freundii]